MKKPQSLHVLLAKRLVLMSIVISLVLSLVAVFQESLRIKEVASDRALVRTGVLRALLWEQDVPPPDASRIQKMLEMASDGDNAAKLRTGYFVLLRVLDSNGTEVARTVDEDYPGIAELESYLKRPKSFVPDHEDKLPDTAMLWSVWPPYLQLNQVLHRNAQGAVDYDVQGFYDIWGPEKRNLGWGLLRAFAATFFIVLLTSLLLYPVIVRLLDRVTRLYRRMLEANLEALQVLGSTIAKRDSDTDEHNFRVTLYSVRLAEALKLDDHQIRLMIKGACLHDVGKIGIRDNILLKPGKLDPSEFEAMKLHVAHGVDIIRRSHWMSEARPVVACHHEKVDGSGYPAGLKGDDIPLLARIFAIADVFDALTSARPYKKAFSYDEAIATLRYGSGTHFDQRILEVFLTLSHPLFELYANREDGAARREVEKITEHYYGADMAVLLE